MWSAAAEKLTAGTGATPVLLAAGILAAAAVRGGGSNRDPEPGLRKQGTARQIVVTLGSLTILLVVGIEAVYTRFGPTVASVLQPLRSGNLSRLDHAALERGYYENLLQVNRFNTQLWEVYSKRPANWLDIESGSLKRHVGGFAQVELIPSFVATTNYGSISINRWGMRDQDYELRPPAGTLRMAVLGPSNVMGWGVSDGNTFEALLERRLNEERAARPFAKYEILNFGVPGYNPPQQLVALDRALAFQPDVLLYVATGREPSRAAHYLAEVTGKNIDIPYPALREIAAKAGLASGMDETTARRRIAPFQSEVLAATYGGIVERCRANGCVAVLVFLPQVTDGPWQEETPEMLRIAKAAGFRIVNLAEIYNGTDRASMRLAEWDEHPNARAHELIAQRLYDKLHNDPDILLQTRK
jgi:hypothetical protein